MKWPLKIQCEIFTCENIGGWGLKMKTSRVKKRGRKEGKGSWCCAFRISFSKCLPRLTPSTAVHVKFKIFYTLRRIEHVRQTVINGVLLYVYKLYVSNK